MDPRRIDLTSLALFRDGFPHDAFRWLRREAPVWWHPPRESTPDGEGFWVISRHADVLRVFQDPETFSSERGGDREHGGTMIADSAAAGVMLNMMDDPRHRRIRQLVNKGFTPRMIEGLTPALRRRTRAILDAAAAQGEVDFVRAVARELPLQAICMLLGVPQEDRSQLCDWVDTSLETLGGDPEAAREAGAALARYAAGLVEEKRARPADDVYSVVIHATLPDDRAPRLSDPELSQFFFLLFAAGSETTRKAIAGGLRALVQAPEQLARLRADLSLLPVAIEEIVRWTTPSVYKRRTATCDLTLHGEKIRAGDKLTVWEMSANRDEQVFDAPFELDVGRDPNPHLGFGFGMHYCLGASLARLEMRLLFEELLPRFPRIELIGPPRYTRDNRLFGLKELPVRLSERA